MAIATPKLELLVDLTKPAEEIETCIMLIAASNPGKQLEILQQVELWLGEQNAKIDNELRKQQTPAETPHKEVEPQS